MENTSESSKKITVIGIGKLGLGFALLLEKAGYNVLGVDIFPEYVENLNKKTINFAEPGLVPPILKLSKLPVEPDDKFTALVLPANDTLKLAAGAPGDGAAIEKVPLTATDCIANGGAGWPGGAGGDSIVPTNLP